MFPVPGEERKESVYRLMISFLVRNCLSMKMQEPQKCLGNAQGRKRLPRWLICLCDPCPGVLPGVT